MREANRDFVVLSGDDSLTLPMMGIGARGVISVVSNIVPEAVSALTSACLAGDFVTGRTLHLALFDLCRAMFVETNPTPVKAAAALLGYSSPEVRLPLAPLSEAAQRRVETRARGVADDGDRRARGLRRRAQRRGADSVRPAPFERSTP